MNRSPDISQKNPLRSPWIVASALLALGVGGYLLLRAPSQPRRAQAEDANLKQELHSLQNEVDRLKATSFLLAAEQVRSTPERSLEEPSKNGAVEVGAEADSQEEAQLDPEELEVLSNERMRAQVDLLDKTWKNESVDPDWSLKASSLLNEKYGEDQFAGVTATADCRWSMCRIDMEFASGDDVGRLGRMVGMNFPWSGKAFFHFNSEEKKGSYYLARENYDLPELGELASR